MKFLVVFILLMSSLMCLNSQTQLDIQGTSNIDTVVKIQVNFIGDGIPIGLSVRALDSGRAGYFYGHHTGVLAVTEVGDGLVGKSVSGNGVVGESLTYHGVLGSSTSGTGLRGSSTSGRGVFGSSTSNHGVLGSSTSGIGIYGVSSTNNGVYGQCEFGIAVKGYSGSNYGVYGSSLSSHGAYFVGSKAAGIADIILGAKDNTGAGDNGVIMSDPDYGGSDIFLISNDAVVVKIDNNQDANEDGNFIVQNGAGTELFKVTETGNVRVLGSSVHTSDRNQKEDITDLKYSDVLQAVLEMPIYEWQYKWENRRHIGPMAQDFHTAFGLGDDDKTIASIDADGVAFAAIKAQQEIINSQQDQIDQQQLELDQLKQEMEELKALILASSSSDK